LDKIAYQTLWEIIKIALIIQVFNLIMDYFIWVTYDYSIPSWTMVTLNVFFTILIFATKVAQEKTGLTKISKWH
jgi:ABC-type bacteriocin/lantibiotic exporter with double-glycine peptidase domain